jgi:hypothetical protein
MIKPTKRLSPIFGYLFHEHINRNWDGILVFEFYNKSSPAEMEAKCKREGRIHLATAQAAAMLALSSGSGSNRGTQRIIDERELLCSKMRQNSIFMFDTPPKELPITGSYCTHPSLS